MCRDVALLRLYVRARRGTQVVRERSAKPLCVGSIPTRASNSLKVPRLRSGFRLRAPVSLTPANRLKFDSDPRLQFPSRSINSWKFNYRTLATLSDGVARTTNLCGDVGLDPKG